MDCRGACVMNMTYVTNGGKDHDMINVHKMW